MKQGINEFKMGRGSHPHADCPAPKCYTIASRPAFTRPDTHVTHLEMNSPWVRKLRGKAV